MTVISTPDAVGRGIHIFVLAIISVCLMVTCKSKKQDGAESGEEEKESASPDSIKTLAGFEVQLIYSVPQDNQGSWVSLSVGPEGRLYASDQQGKGVYRITVGDAIKDPEVQVEELMMPVTGAQGLIWAFDSFYANVNGKGVFRINASRSDSTLDVMRYLGGPRYEGEHGNHALLPTPDGEGLYVVNGNHTPPPELTSSRVASWQEDILLPRQWDARGHARGIMAPGGYIARINPDATEWRMISMGYRNIYDAAVMPNGELFTYDSDMEWDMGLPWYRPTRLVHVVSGSDYGWRGGSGKWKPYYEDSLPPVLNVGPGSPTGLFFGTGADFPARYQRALFGLDWTFGTMYAFHISPDGASYTAEAEEFLSGSPLPLTDGVIGKDGAMYFITGGREQDSKLYRVIYTGEKSTASAEPKVNPEARKARALRHQLEAFHGRQDPEAVETAWPHLGSDDRFIRNAARAAVEAQPAESWVQKALSEERPQARITSIVALARTAAESYRSEAIESLLELDLSTLETGEKLGYMRAMSLIFMRMGRPDDAAQKRIADRLIEHLPQEDSRVNTELIRLLVYLKDSRVIGETLALMQKKEKVSPPEWGELIKRNHDYGETIRKMINNPPPTHKLEYAFILRNLRNGWTIPQRRQYFTFINDAADQMGGESYSGFLTDMRAEALSNASEKEREAVSDLTGVSLAQEPDFEIHPPEGPGREWTVEEAVEAVEGHLDNRNFENGRNAFFAVSCATCHRFDGYGGNIGPDLGTVSNRFSTEGLLEAVITPSALISDQYSSSQVKLHNGKTLTGLVIEQQDSLEIYSRNPEQPPTVVARKQVISVEPVDVSQMPPGLINSLNAEELRDLVAYLKSGGDPEHKLFQEDEE